VPSADSGAPIRTSPNSGTDHGFTTGPARSGKVPDIPRPVSQGRGIISDRQILTIPGKYSVRTWFREYLFIGNPWFIDRYLLREIGADGSLWYPELVAGEFDFEGLVIRTPGNIADNMSGGTAHICRREVSTGQFQQINGVYLKGNGGGACIRKEQLVPEKPRGKFFYVK
jgi:hypothetical protein